MAQKTWDQEIDKNVDWGGSGETGNLPVSGKYVQKFIKDSLNKKFGFIYYDDGTEKDIDGFKVRPHELTGKAEYKLFADFEDFTEWVKDGFNNSSPYILGVFDAPAPATFNVDLGEDFTYNKIVLESNKLNENIEFKYKLNDSQNQQINSGITVDITIANQGIIKFSKQYSQNAKSNEDTIFDFNTLISGATGQKLGDYLDLNNNTVTIRLVSNEYSVFRVININYNVIVLNLSTTFDNTKAIDYTATDVLNIPIICEGNVTNKKLNVKIDGFDYDFNTHDIVTSNPDNTAYYKAIRQGNNGISQENLELPFRKLNNNNQYQIPSWLTRDNSNTAIKHTITMYFYYTDNNNNDIKSNVIYREFILVNGNAVSITDKDFILLSSDNMSEDNGFTINVEQYASFIQEYMVVSSRNTASNVDVNINIVDKNIITGVDDQGNNQYKLIKNYESIVNRSKIQSFQWSYDDLFDDEIQNKELSLSISVKDDERNIDVNVSKSQYQISAETEGLIFEFKAKNRSNSDKNYNEWIYQYLRITGEIGEYRVNFPENFKFNDENGWINDALVLSGENQFITINHNIFADYENNQGLTFEIEFETSNIQNEEAVIMEYGNVDDNHQLINDGIIIKACGASCKNSNYSIETKYKDNSRQKIQFIFNHHVSKTADITGIESPNLMYMVVNGILDRSTILTEDSLYSNGDNYTTIKIGGSDEVTVKIYSIRCYKRALTLDECVNNYIADSNDLKVAYAKNNVDDNGVLNIDKILGLGIPVMKIYGDVTTSIVKKFNKKSNIPVDVIYQDPLNPEFNFFAHDAWLSNQGTSSMHYPRRNLRLYFNKPADNNTMRGFGSDSNYEFNTKVWRNLSNDQIKDINSNIASIDEYASLNLGIPMTNKKYVKDGEYNTPYNIFYITKDKDEAIELAKMFLHSGINLASTTELKDDGKLKDRIGNKGKSLNSFIEEEEAKEGGLTAIYAQGAYTRFKLKDLFTDRWTLKCDYAESSMTHNAGVGRLWNDVMKNAKVSINNQTINVGATNAQLAAMEYESRNKNEKYGDIRTSCDGTPIVIFNYPRTYNNGEWGFGQAIYLGLYNIMTDKGSTPLFGFEDLYSEESNNGKPTKIFDASKCECWECLQNGSELAKMTTVVTDKVGNARKDRLIWSSFEARWPDEAENTPTNNLETLIRFVNYCKDAISVEIDGRDAYSSSEYITIEEAFNNIDDVNINEVELSNIQQVKDALSSKYDWNGIYYLQVPKKEYSEINSKLYDDDGVLLDDEALMNKLKGLVPLYVQKYSSDETAGISESFSKIADIDNIDLDTIKNYLNEQASICQQTDSEDDIEMESTIYDESISDDQWYIYDSSYDRSKITKNVSTKKITSPIYLGMVESFDAKNPLDDWKDEDTNEYPLMPVIVYLTKNGNEYYYTDEFGKQVRYNYNEAATKFQNIMSESDGWGVNVPEGIKIDYTATGSPLLMKYFSEKKYDHFDVWKLAAYYIYMMRFASVDQVIKNTMMTTEDGQHYYFINYDNDTILGVRNDGYLVYDWQIDRNTYDYSSGGYAYAGFTSVLWNLLELDDEFMDKVRTLATVLSSNENGLSEENMLTYQNVLNMFNVKQAGTWNARLYNKSEQYKYIDTWLDNLDANSTHNNKFTTTKYLGFLQGSRASHREWWLRHRFDLYDAKWGAGEYANSSISFKSSDNTSFTMQFPQIKFKISSKYYYGIQKNNGYWNNTCIYYDDPNSDDNYIYIVNNGQANAELTDTSLIYKFWAPEKFEVGDPPKILGSHKMTYLDLSNIQAFTEINIEYTENAKESSTLTELNLGGDGNLKHTIDTLSGINYLANSLTTLNIRNCQFTTLPDLSDLPYLTTLLADKSNLRQFKKSNTKLYHIELPSSNLNTISLVNCEINKLDLIPGKMLTNVEIRDCKFVDDVDSFDLISFINTWVNTIVTDFKGTNINNPSKQLSGYNCILSIDNDNELVVPEKIEISQNLKTYISWYYINESKPLTDVITINDDDTISGADFITMLRIIFGTIKDNLNNTIYHFDITSGSIKFDQQLSKKEYDGLINSWSISCFEKSGDGVKFNASKSSTFITISEKINNEYNYYEYSITNDDTITSTNILSGKTININVTQLPLSNNAKFEFVPYVWSENINNYQLFAIDNNSDPNTRKVDPQRIYHTDRGYTTLQNSNDTCSLTISRDTFIKENIKIELIYDDGNIISRIKTIYIPVELIVKPENQDISISDITVNANNVEPISTKYEIIDVSKNYKFDIGFTNNNQLNVELNQCDIDIVDENNTIIDKCGFITNKQLREKDINQTNKFKHDGYQFEYVPSLEWFENNNETNHNNETFKNINFNITIYLSDNSTITSKLPVILYHRHIHSIAFVKDNDVISNIVDDYMTINSYAKINESGIQSEFIYELKLYDIEHNDTNVGINNIELVNIYGNSNLDSSTVSNIIDEIKISLRDEDINGNRKLQFTLPTSDSSYDGDITFELQIKDNLGFIFTQNIRLNVGWYYPDIITIEDNGNNINKFIKSQKIDNNSNNSNNIVDYYLLTIPLNESAIGSLQIKISSITKDNSFEWSESLYATNKLSDIEYVINNITTTINVNLRLTKSNYNAIIEYDYTNGQNDQFGEITFILNINCNTKLSRSVQEFELTINRIDGISYGFDYKYTTVSDGFYLVDVNGIIYKHDTSSTTLNTLKDESKLYCIIYVYSDTDGQKHYISIDPTLFLEQNESDVIPVNKMWWKYTPTSLEEVPNDNDTTVNKRAIPNMEESSFYTYWSGIYTGGDGVGNYSLGSKQLSEITWEQIFARYDNTIFKYILNKYCGVNDYQSEPTDINNGKLFKAYVLTYIFKCLGVALILEKTKDQFAELTGITALSFTSLIGGNTYDLFENINNFRAIMNDVITPQKLTETLFDPNKYSISYEFNSNYIFSVINKYANSTNHVCKLLDGNEYNMLINALYNNDENKNIFIKLLKLWYNNIETLDFISNNTLEATLNDNPSTDHTKINNTNGHSQQWLYLNNDDTIKYPTYTFNIFTLEQSYNQIRENDPDGYICANGFHRFKALGIVTDNVYNVTGDHFLISQKNEEGKFEFNVDGALTIQKPFRCIFGPELVPIK